MEKSNLQKTQLNIKDISAHEFDRFLEMFHRDLKPVKVKPTADNHFVVYNYGEGKDKFNVCYDTVAHCMQATAEEMVLVKVKSCVYAVKSVTAQSEKKSEHSTPISAVSPTQSAQAQNHSAHKNSNPSVFEKPLDTIVASPVQIGAAPVNAGGKSAQMKVNASNSAKLATKDAPQLKDKKTERLNKKNLREQAKSAKKDKEQESAVVLDTAAQSGVYKDGYSLSKYDLKRLEDGIRALGEQSAIQSIVREESQADTAQHFIKFSITAKDRSKAIVQYAIKRQVVQIQGKPSDLTDLVQNALSGTASETEIIKARVDYNKTRTKKSETPEIVPASNEPTPAAIKKSLMKSLPHGLLFLSKQSQTYLYYALIDLGSNLSNYGGILATAYQGLENLISNLQHAQSIKVKMIGQAYEKEGNKYALKASYRRHITSVVFNEVMSDLYTEYFDKRHYYTHSDNFSDTARVLNNQAEAKQEFARLVSLIDYNCAKLQEIGFRIGDSVVK